jgi:hypothetical protein
MNNHVSRTKANVEALAGKYCRGSARDIVVSEKAAKPLISWSA